MTVEVTHRKLKGEGRLKGGGGNLQKRHRNEGSEDQPRAPKNFKVNQDSSNVSTGKASETSSKAKSGFRSTNSAPRSSSKPFASTSHRFGRVMESVPCRNRPRFSTVSIAVPGSVLSNCQTKELRTLMVGQIARAATIYHVDEIIVFDDKLGSSNTNRRTDWRKQGERKKEHETKEDVKDSKDTLNEENDEDREKRPRTTSEEFMARLLQYCECPQYLRRHFFPMHPDLQFAGLLAPIDAPHHVRAEDHSPYREGVVLPQKSKDGTTSLVNCGIRSRPVEIDRKLAAGIRCTVKIDPTMYGKAGVIKGKVVSPSAPRQENGTYWGYTTRIASSINDVFDSCPYEGGYDLKIGTSERGDKSVEEKNFKLPHYEHSLIVFGGVSGIEECVDADESIKLPGSQSKKLFDLWLNTCPFQGSRTIRTEEAVMISLAQLSSPLIKSARFTEMKQPEEEVITNVEFSDDSPSDESSSSSDGEGSGDEE